MRNKLAVVLSAALVAGLSAGTAFAGEIKGPPYQGDPVPGGIGNESNTTPATSVAHSLCAFSGLNDYDSLIGQTSKPAQTPADGPAGAPGQGLEVAPGVFISCRGNG